MQKNHFSKLETKQKTPLEIQNSLLSRRAGAMGMVLLENSDILPLAPCGVALFGGGARHTVKGGTGSGDVNTREIVTVEQGLENSGFTILTKSWLDACDAAFAQDEMAWQKQIDEIAKQRNVARVGAYLETVHLWAKPPAVTENDVPQGVETAVYVIARRCGEGADRVLQQGDYYLYDTEKQALRLLAKKCKKLIVVLNLGGVIDTGFYREIQDIGALLLMSQPGQCAGDALADILCGKVTPGGKLTATWANDAADYAVAPTQTEADGTLSMPYTEGIFVGYRHFDATAIKPRYPFGYGLSYTSFAYKNLALHEKQDSIIVTVTVENTGKTFSGAEIVQIYAALPSGRVPRPKKILVGFQKTACLEPGQTETLQIEFSKEQLASYAQAQQALVLEAGSYEIFAGKSSADLYLAGQVKIAFTTVLRRLENYWQEEGHKNRRSAVVPDAETEQTKTLTDAQLISLVVGECTGAEQSIVGQASDCVPGAAGQTTCKINGVPSLIMADGPCGLRLIPYFQTDEKGNLVNAVEMGALESGRFGTKQAQTQPAAHDYYQYCTCFPIGTALAQTWDETILQKIGNAVAQEMEYFGISLWLAPGMNIQRDPLCGRNFEYYSEDPLLTGKIAAAMVRGVQSVPGKGAVIKHFACNNRENGRLGGNSIVETQALREIYLKPFEIAVKESSPAAMMSAYNAVNGEQAANSYALCTGIARGEWQYEGVIMTDWGTTDFGTDAVQCIKAGNDLIMPGDLKDIEKLQQALQSDALSRAELARCAQRVLRMVLYLAKQ